MNIDVLSIKDKVQRYLTDVYEKVVVDSDGDFSFRIGSTQMWVAVSQVDKKENRAPYVAVRVFANTNNRVPPSPGLFEYVAFHGRFAFGANLVDAFGHEFAALQAGWLRLVIPVGV